MNKSLKNILHSLIVALLASGCNSGTGSVTDATAPDWQNEVTISHSSSLPYSVQGVNSYWLTVSNQTANYLRLKGVSLIETSLEEVNINQIVDISECKALSSGADCQLKINLPKDLAISGTPLIYFSLNFINDKTGESYVVKKPLTLYTNPEAESGVDFEYSSKYLNQNIVDTAKSYSIALPFRLTQDYQSLALNVTGAKALSQKIICSNGSNYHQGDSCSALVKFDRKETNPQIKINGLNKEGVSNNLAVGLNITPNVVANLVYLNAPLLVNPAKPTQTVTVLNDGVDIAKNIKYTFTNPESVGVTVTTTDCKGTTLVAGATCHWTYTLDTSKYLSGAPKEQITYTNGTALAGKTVDSYYVYTIPPIKSTINITTSSGKYNIGDLMPTQFFTINATLSGVSSINQTVSVSNLNSLQAAGMVIVSTQTANPTTCTINSTTKSCDFYIIASNIVLANSYTLNLVNSGSTIIDHPSITYNIVAAPPPASTIRLPQTGQTTRYALFDDATYLMGVQWAKSSTGTTPQRFTVGTGAEANCVTDNLTGLMWVKDLNTVKIKNGANGAYTSWQNALDSIAAANTSGGYCGYTDWHLPTVNELSSVLNDAASPSGWLNTQGFSNVQADYYWSSSTLASVTGRAWYVHFFNGIVNAFNKTNYDYVWPVRLVR